jgi:hypothetical protein
MGRELHSSVETQGSRVIEVPATLHRAEVGLPVSRSLALFPPDVGDGLNVRNETRTVDEKQRTTINSHVAGI